MFCIGGGSYLSRKERDDIRADVDAEFEAEERVLKQKKNKRKNLEKKSHAAEDDFGSLFGDGITGKLPRYANKITFKVQGEKKKKANDNLLIWFFFFW